MNDYCLWSLGRLRVAHIFGAKKFKREEIARGLRKLHGEEPHNLWSSSNVIKKVKLSRYTLWRRLGGEDVQFLIILNFGTRWGEWSASRPGRALPPVKGPPVPIGQEAGWAPEPVWTQRLEEKSSASVGDRTPVRHHADWATPAHTHCQ
jgi:hypothetical protein